MGVTRMAGVAAAFGRDLDFDLARITTIVDQARRAGVTLLVLAPAPDHQERHALRVAARVANSGGRLQLEGVW